MPIFKMEDGRVFTDYNPSCSLNKFLQDKFNTQNSHDYRYYLQRNADKIHDDFNRCAVKDVNRCVVCPVCSSALTWKPTGNI